MKESSIMKAAISNIAWEKHDDPEVLNFLKSSGISGIEIAPTKIWADWSTANYLQAVKYKQFLNNLGFQVPAMQAILFGKPELQVFAVEAHKAFVEHFKLLAELAAALECKTLVFGAPKNRKRNSLAYNDGLKIACDLFRQLGDVIADSGAAIGIEANPVEYGCDFLTALSDVRNFTDLVAHDCVKNHIDTAAVAMCTGDIEREITLTPDIIHFHLSEPMLAPLIRGSSNNLLAIAALKNTEYNNWVSIEMKQPDTPKEFRDSVTFIMKAISDD